MNRVSRCLFAAIFLCAAMRVVAEDIPQTQRVTAAQREHNRFLLERAKFVLSMDSMRDNVRDLGRGIAHGRRDRVNLTPAKKFPRITMTSRVEDIQPQGAEPPAGNKVPVLDPFSGHTKKWVIRCRCQLDEETDGRFALGTFSVTLAGEELEYMEFAGDLFASGLGSVSDEGLLDKEIAWPLPEEEDNPAECLMILVLAPVNGGPTIIAGVSRIVVQSGTPVQVPTTPEEAVHWIERNRGKVTYDGDKVVRVGLGSNRLTDLSPLALLTDLEELHVGGMAVQDLTFLSGLTNLEKLTLGLTKATDLTPLENLRDLKSLTLQGMPISDLSPLEHMTELTRLELRGGTARDLSPLGDLTKLTFLHLDHLPVSDLTPLSKLAQLEFLFLGYTEVTDLTPLAKLSNLKTVVLMECPITDEEITKLREIMPNCEIRR